MSNCSGTSNYFEYAEMLANKLTPVSPGRNGKQNKWSDLKDFHLLIHKLE